jgi:hypothetical protein
MAGFGAVYREGNPIEIDSGGGAEQLGINGVRHRAPEYADRTVQGIGESNHLHAHGMRGPRRLRRRVIGIPSHHPNRPRLRVGKGNDLGSLGLLGGRFRSGPEARRRGAAQDLDRTPGRIGEGDELDTSGLIFDDLLDGLGG